MTLIKHALYLQLQSHNFQRLNLHVNVPSLVRINRSCRFASFTTLVKTVRYVTLAYVSSRYLTGFQTRWVCRTEIKRGMIAWSIFREAHVIIVFVSVFWRHITVHASAFFTPSSWDAFSVNACLAAFFLWKTWKAVPASHFYYYNDLYLGHFSGTVQRCKSFTSISSTTFHFEIEKL